MTIFSDTLSSRLRVLISANMKSKFLLLSSLLLLSLITGCAPVLIGSATVTGASLAADRRNVGAVTNDGLIETKSALHLSQTNFSSSHITTTSYEGNVLLSGEIGSEEDKNKVTEIVKSVNGVNNVYNELAVMPNSSFTTRMNDSITASKIRAALLDNKQVTLTSLKVVVDRGIAYLIGSVTEQEAQIISKIASKVQSVEQVVCLFNIISPEELEKRKFLDAESKTGSLNNNGEGAETGPEGVEVTPIKM